MKKVFLVFAVILLIGCGTKGTDNTEKLNFLKKADEIQKQRIAYGDSISRFPDKRNEYLKKQIELNEEVKKMETIKDWAASDTIKNKFLSAFHYDTIFTVPGKDSLEMLFSKTSFGLDRLGKSVEISKLLLDEREKLVKK